MASFLAAKAFKRALSTPAFRSQVSKVGPVGLRTVAGACGSPFARFDRYSHSVVRPSLVLAARFSTQTDASRDTPTRDTHLVAEAKANLAKGNFREAWGLHPEAGAIGQSGIWKKYGVLPTAFLALTALVSKEILILDEELILVGTFSAFVFCAYTLFGDTLKDSLASQISEIRTEQQNSLDERISSLKKVIQAKKEMLNIVDIIGTTHKQYVEMADQYNAARSLRLQHQTLKYVERKLQEIVDSETEMRANIASGIVDRSKAFIEEKVRAADQQLKDDLFTSALARFQHKAGVPNPLLKLHHEFFNRLAERQKAMATKKIKLNAQQIERLKQEQRTLAEKFKAELGVDVPETPIKAERQLVYRI